MREIIFRGKHEGKWVYGSLLIVKPTEGILEPLHYYICPLEVSDMYRVDPDTVGQYTGLKDKNGRDIYEGDIVRCIANFDKGNCVVIYEDGEFRLIPDKYYRSYTTGGGFHAVRCFSKEVVGNIHDNPELLKE